MELLTKIINFTFMPLVLITLLRAITLLKKSRIERALLSEEQKILVHLSRFVFMFLVFSILTIITVEWLSGESIAKYKNEELFEIIVMVVTIAFMIAVLVYSYVPLILAFIGKTRKYYIEHDKYGRLYILKLSSKDRIILSNKPYINSDDAMVIIVKREEVESKPIFCEVNGGYIISDIRNTWRRYKEKKQQGA